MKGQRRENLNVERKYLSFTRGLFRIWDKWYEKSYITICGFSFIRENIFGRAENAVVFIVEATSPDIDCQKTIGIVIRKRIVTTMPVVNFVDNMNLGL